MSTGRELLADLDLDVDPGAVTIDDGDVLELLDPVVREWWVESFGEYVPGNDGFFTPPQKEAIPLIHRGENALICAPTGSGKCVKPDTPLIVEQDGTATVVRAKELLDHRERKLADVDEDGTLFSSDVESYSLNDGVLETRRSHVYTESYEGDLFRFETKYGRSVEVTPEHPVLVDTPDGPEWRPARAVSEGDRLGVPKRIELPERPVDLDVQAAIGELEDTYPVVLTEADGDRLLDRLNTASNLSDLTERERRELLSLATLSMEDVASRLGISPGTVHRMVTGETDYRDDELLDVLRSDVSTLGDREVLVRTDDGRVSRFRYPTSIDENVASLASFVLAEGFIGEYESAGMISISQKKRRDLLHRAIDTMSKYFDMQFRAKNEQEFVITDGPFALFFSTLLGIDSGPGRSVSFPDWVLNAPKPIKRSFVSTFLSLEADITESEVCLTQASELKIEQLNYLLLSFGIFPARSVRSKCATNTEDQTSRDYYDLTIRGVTELRRLLDCFDLEHPKIELLKGYVGKQSAGTHGDKYRFDRESIRSLSTYVEDDAEFRERVGNIYEGVSRTGYSTDGALSHLESELKTLPDGGVTATVQSEIDSTRDRNVAWLEVTDAERVPYDGRIIDLSVPETHNFVGGRGGMYLHNTLASFSGIINELFRRDRESGLENSVYCLYVSPLKSLANDIHRNLELPLAGIAEKLDDRGTDVEIRHAIRHGDTPDAERQRMLEETPHILNTTPETLAILLNSPKFKEKLRTVEYVVVDEIHSLAENKRGTHLSVSLERLEHVAETSPTRIGCSATVEPLDTMAEFLVGCDEPGGSPRDYEIVDTRFAREFDIELTAPTDDLIHTPRDVVNERFYRQLHELIQDHTNTLVFTNTRSGAERVLHNLRERFGAYDEDNAGCHHGSLSKEKRQRIEHQLKEGTLDVVTTSTSLELGIDMPHIDLVVQVGSPKSVAALLQRVGRAGHQLGQTVTGRVVALDRDELVECAVMLAKAESGFVDRVFVPENAQDVAVQQVYGMAINGPRPEAEIDGVLRRAYPYRDYDDADWEQLMRYMTADYPGMEDRNVYAKIWRDENDPPDGDHHYEAYPVGTPLIGKRGRLARVIYMTNIGTIPDSFTCDVKTRGDDQWVGQLDEEYLDTLETGDVFVLGGDRYEFRYRRGSKVYVDPTSDRPTVPSWYSERLPLSYDLGQEILTFQRDLLERLQGGGKTEARVWLREFPIDEDAVRAIVRMFDEQVRYAGPESVSTDERLVVEEELDHDEYERRYYVHLNYGRRVNDGFSRLLAYRIAQEANANVSVAVADNGFSLSLPLNRKVDVHGILESIDPDDARADLRASLAGTDLLDRYFRINATRSLMILKRYKGYEKSASEQQVNSDMLLGFADDLADFAVIEETYREIIADKLHVAGIEAILRAIQDDELTVRTTRVTSPTPLAFGLATLMASDVVLAEDESRVLAEFHRRVVEEIQGEEAPDDGGAASSD